jgi:hypothetical protein
MTGLTFEPIAHRYDLDGVRVPSVTQVLQRSGIINFDGIPEPILEAARVRGTIVHSALHYYNDRDLDGESFRSDFPTYAGYLDAWETFCRQRHYEPILNEHRVASRRHKVAGTIDSLGLLDGKAVLLDFATGRPHDVAKNLQTAAYHGLAMEWAAEKEDPALGLFMAQHRVIRRYAVQLRKDGTFVVEPYVNPTDYRQFMVLLEAQRVVDAHRGEAFAFSEVA